MKRKLIKICTVVICLLMSMNSNTINAQAPIQNGTSDYNYDIWHLKNFGVGSNLRPDARIHIFNGESNFLDAQARNSRPFLISGFVKTFLSNDPITGNPIYYNVPKDYFTVDEKGFVGIDFLKPVTKLHLHKGIFTFSDGVPQELKRWEIYGTNEFFGVKDFDAGDFCFWINKSDGNVGIGNDDPQEKLHIKGGRVNIENVYGTTIFGSANSSFSHFVTSLPKFYFNKSLMVNGALSSYSSDLELQAQGVTKMTVKTNGQVDIGVQNITAGTHTDYKLSVDGKIVSKKVVVTLDNWADNVFDKDYKLKTLEEVEAYIAKEKHLPEIPSETEVMEEGIELGEINMLLLKKVEELTLYMIEMQKEIDDLKSK